MRTPAIQRCNTSFLQLAENLQATCSSCKKTYVAVVLRLCGLLQYNKIFVLFYCSCIVVVLHLCGPLKSTIQNQPESLRIITILLYKALVRVHISAKWIFTDAHFEKFLRGHVRIVPGNMHVKFDPGNVYANFDFCTLLFSSYEPVRDRRTERRTDRRTGKTRNAADRTAA